MPIAYHWRVINAGADTQNKTKSRIKHNKSSRFSGGKMWKLRKCVGVLTGACCGNVRRRRAEGNDERCGNVSQSTDTYRLVQRAGAIPSVRDEV